MTGLSLTQRQHDALTYIQAYMGKNKGRAPSFEQMKEALGLASKSGVHRLLLALEERGHIYRVPNRARCIQLFSDAEETAKELPLDVLTREIEARGFTVCARANLEKAA